jgi:hypothetical protein
MENLALYCRLAASAKVGAAFSRVPRHSTVCLALLIILSKHQQSNIAMAGLSNIIERVTRMLGRKTKSSTGYAR